MSASFELRRCGYLGKVDATVLTDELALHVEGSGTAHIRERIATLISLPIGGEAAVSRNYYARRVS